MTKCFTTLGVEQYKLGTLMKNKDSKSGTPVWVWVVIFLIILHSARIAHRNDWFIEKKNIPNKYEKPEWFDELVNRILTEKQIKDLENRVYEYDESVKEGRRDQ